METIKFRAWDKENNKMLSNTEIEEMTLHEIQDEDGGDFYEFMEYTGLKDKNGKEIYEGDIVKFGLDSDINNIEKVEFFNGGFGVNGKTFDWESRENSYDYIEVIGNIYENKDLIININL